jgi:carboxylesterase type B
MLFVFEALSRAPIPLPTTPNDDAEMTTVHGCWVSFIKTGAPVCPNAPAWPAYSAADRLMLFGPSQAVVEAGFRNAAYNVFDRIETDALAKSKPR